MFVPSTLFLHRGTRVKAAKQSRRRAISRTKYQSLAICICSPQPEKMELRRTTRDDEGAGLCFRNNFLRSSGCNMNQSPSRCALYRFHLPSRNHSLGCDWPPITFVQSVNTKSRLRASIHSILVAKKSSSHKSSESSEAIYSPWAARRPRLRAAPCP